MVLVWTALTGPFFILFILATAESLAMTVSSKTSVFLSRISLSVAQKPPCHSRHLRRTLAVSSFRRSPMLMMPEGPEVRTVVNQLQGAVGRHLAGIDFLSGRYSLRNPPSGYDRFLPTMQYHATSPRHPSDYEFTDCDIIQEWNCKGKFIYIILDEGKGRSNRPADEGASDTDAEADDFQRSIWITLGMTGRFVNEPTHQQLLKSGSNSVNHARWCLVLVSKANETKRIYYYDTRSFGTLKFSLSKQELQQKLQSLGPDILQSTTTLHDFYHSLISSSPSMNLCKFLMNQSKLAGVGNYLLAEALYRANMDPFCTLQEVLHDEVNDDEKDGGSGTRYERLFHAIQAVARESYDSQQPHIDSNSEDSFEMHCYGRTTCIRGNPVIQDTNGPHGRTIWYTREQLFMPLQERIQQQQRRAETTTSSLGVSANTDDAAADSDASVEHLLAGLTEPSWRESLEDATRSTSFRALAAFLEEERRNGAIVYPPHDEIFTALNLGPINKVKVVIIGQDPYHGPGQGHGLAFSVKHGVPPPPSLKNVIREAMHDVHIDSPRHGNLEHWARQGVLLLNTVLTVRRGEANSHAKKGWEQFTDACIQRVNEERSGVVFLLWGNPAAKKASVVDSQRHVIIKTSHPSPLGAMKTASPFLGSRCFSLANAALAQQGKEPIDWSII